ncbi:hypothetical protein [Novosphingobium sp. 9U]|nr:hypothetical protein [Novosphingobium sp. 9U]
MARVILLASHARRTASETVVLRTLVVSGCALALILAKVPLSL